MLSIKQVCEMTGLTLHTFQSWRRGGANLLPKPIAVDKRVIYFDDSILERIKFIRDQQAAGQSLTQIEEMLKNELAEDARRLPRYQHILEVDFEDFKHEIRALQEKWESGQCRDELCTALKLDPKLTGEPVTFCLPAADKPAGGLMVYASLISRDVVHFVEVYVDLYDSPEVKQSVEIAVGDFGMLLNIIGQEFAERKQVFKTELIPYLLFCGLKDTGADTAFWRESLEVAPIMNQITEASRQYLVRLKQGDICLP